MVAAVKTTTQEAIHKDIVSMPEWTWSGFVQQTRERAVLNRPHGGTKLLELVGTAMQSVAAEWAVVGLIALAPDCHWLPGDKSPDPERCGALPDQEASTDTHCDPWLAVTASLGCSPQVVSPLALFPFQKGMPGSSSAVWRCSHQACLVQAQNTSRRCLRSRYNRCNVLLHRFSCVSGLNEQ